MRPKYEHKAHETKAASVNRDPSYPDRARIDSDVRAFLRPASSPWIVFDRDSRVDADFDFAKSALRVGAVFASTPNFRALPDNPEPSNLVVAADVVPSSSSAIPEPADDPASLGSRADIAAPPRSTRRPLGAMLAVAAVTIAAAASATAIGMRSEATRAAAVAIPEAEVLRSMSPLVAETSAQPPRAEAAPAPAPPDIAEAAPPAGAPTPAKKVSTDPRKRFGRLSIRGHAKHKSVYFDGKRMLGVGSRSFVVLCGMHTIGVNDKADAKDVEIPCNGEYVVR